MLLVMFLLEICILVRFDFEFCNNTIVDHVRLVKVAPKGAYSVKAWQNLSPREVASYFDPFTGLIHEPNHMHIIGVVPLTF